jgi:hypothetical protein
MPALDVAEVELTLDAKHQIAAHLEVTAGLAATDKGAVIFTAEVRAIAYPCCIHPAEAGADVAADVAAGPVVHRRHHRASLERQVGRRCNTRTTLATSEKRCNGISEFSGKGVTHDRVDAELTTICAKTLSFSVLPAAAPLTLANSPLCSASTRPGIETRYLE